jgi:NAD dependent epimerase/dehydratase
MNWRGKKVLVTGAGGFIGSHLVEALIAKGAKTTAYVHYNSRNDWGWIETFNGKTQKKLSVIAGDVRDSENIRRAVRGNEVVFHLASLISIPFSYEATRSYLATNLMGGMNIVQACLEGRVEKLVHTSTSEVYGTAQYVPIDEAHALQAQSPYSASKISADKVAESYFFAHGLRVGILRPFNTFGPRQSARAIIPTIISQALKRKEIVIGSLDPVRDFLFVNDTVEGFIKMAESGRTVGETVHIGSGRGVSVGDLIRTIGRLLGRELRVKSDPKRFRPEKSEVMRLVCDNRKAKKLMGWEPSHSLEDGLRETIAWIDKNPDYFKAELYNV